MSIVIIAVDHLGVKTVVGVAPTIESATRYIRRMQREVQEIKIDGVYHYRDFRECDFLVIDQVPEIM